MTTIKERIENNFFYEVYKIFLKDKKGNYNRYNSILKKTIFISQIGNESKFGEVYKGYLSINDNNTEIAIKKIPLSLIDLKIFLLNQENEKSVIFNTKTIWKEIYILKLCSKLIKLKKSIHLPLYYFYTYSSINTFTKNYAKNSPYIYTYCELANEDLKSWSSKERTFNEWISCFLQIFFSLYVLQYYFGLLHNDLHWGNVLVFNIKKGGYWTYIINNKSYHIMNEGFLFVVWDFGLASLNPSIKECKDNIKSCQDFLKILNTPKWVKKHYPNIIIPKSIIDFCLYIRSDEYENMNDILNSIINKLTTNKKTFNLETFSISKLI